VTRRFALLLVAAVGVSAAPPQRIVSTAPSITELLFALGLGDHVVGVTRFCRYPPEAQKIVKIGDYINPNIEAIASLKPDLVIVQANPIRLTERLNALHLRTVEIDQQNVPLEQALYKSIRAVGEATDTRERATALIANVRSGLDEVRRKAARFPPVRSMFVVGRAPGRLDGLIVVGNASYLNDVIAIAGGDNVFRDAVAPYPAVSLESVLARNPEVIIDAGEGNDDRIADESHRREAIAVWRRAGSLAAVKEHRVFPIASEVYVTPGPRVVEAGRALLAMFHPEAK
jgi:iron complex transport system substrate-binding protein